MVEGVAEVMNFICLFGRAMSFTLVVVEMARLTVVSIAVAILAVV